MTKKETNDQESPSSAQAPLTVAAVQRMIDASFIRFKITHGHLSAEDGARLLDALKD